jgi:cytochrome c oxidase subunit 2
MAVTLVLVALSAGLSVATAGPGPSPSDLHVIDVTASRGHFEPPVLDVVEGEAVRIVIRSRDVAHGFKVPKLKIDQHVPAGGGPVTIELTAPSPGRFEIVCSEFCGRGHEAMRAAIVSRSAHSSR